jgi:hypothetical protein
MLVFIAESGDPGFKLKKGSTPIFIIALVAFRTIRRVSRKPPSTRPRFG